MSFYCAVGSEETELSPPELNDLLTESTKLVSTIRSDPKKYLTIHMKIF